MGFLVLLAPAYLGYEGGDEGWYQSMVSAGPEALRQYGRFVGERFADLDNIIWVHGGDFTPPNDDLDLVEAVRNGIIEGGARQLHTAHWSPETSAIDVDVDWLDLNTTYTYGPVYVKSSADDRDRRPAPPRHREPVRGRRVRQYRTSDFDRRRTKRC